MTNKYRIQKLLQKEKLDALLLYRVSDITLMTNTFPQWGLSFCLQLQSGEQYLFVPYLEPSDTYNEVENVIIFGWGDPKCSDPWQDFYNKLKNVFVKHGLTSLGISQNFSHATLGVNNAENSPLPYDIITNISKSISIKDIDCQLHTIYMYKDEQAIQCIQKTHQVVELAIKVFYSMLKEGVRDIEIVAEIEKIIRIQCDGSHIKFAQAWAYINAGSDSPNAWKYGRNRGISLKKHDVLMLELAVCIDGYWADISRTGFIEEPTDKHKKLYDIVSKAQLMAIDMLKPKVKAVEVHNTILAFFQEQGVREFYPHATGHHVGYRYHDVGFMISGNSDGEFEEGMLVTIEPGLYIPDQNFGCRIEDNILITSSAYQNLSSNILRG